MPMHTANDDALDRQLVTETMNSVLATVDHRDWERLRDIFMSEVVLDYRSFDKGGDAVTVPVDAIIGRVKQELGCFTATRHMLTGHAVRVDGDMAEARAAAAVHLYLNGDDGDEHLKHIGDYSAKLRRIDGRWRIAHWGYNHLWSEGDPGVAEKAQAAAQTER